MCVCVSVVIMWVGCGCVCVWVCMFLFFRYEVLQTVEVVLKLRKIVKYVVQLKCGVEHKLCV